MLCCIAELCHCTRLPGMGGWEPCTSFTQSIRHSLHHRFPFSCIRCSSCTQMLAIIHDLCLMSHHVVSCHVPGISSRSGHAFLLLSTQCAPSCIAQWRHMPHPTTQPWNICLQAGMQWCACNVCSRGQASGQRPSSASIFCKPRCLLLVARLQQTRLIELTLCPNLVTRGRCRKRAS